MKFSLHHLMAFIVMVALLLQGVETLVVRKELGYLEYELDRARSEQLRLQDTGALRSQPTEVCRTVVEGHQTPIDYKIIEARYQRLLQPEAPE